MDAVTYPHPSVQSAIAESFVPFKINMLERDPELKEAGAGRRVMWGPTFVVADARGGELRRWVGWLPPEAFVAELDFSRALGAYHRGKFAEARSEIDQIVARGAGTELHAEALYWQGIAGFMAGPKDWTALRESWSELAASYPGNRFGTHASVIEDAPE